MKSVCLTLNWKQLKHLKKNKFLIALLKKCYVHQLHLHQLHRPRITKNLDGHLLPDGGHISVGPVEGIPVRQQVLNHSQCMGPTVSPAINHVNKHYNGMLLKPIVKENFKYWQSSNFNSIINLISLPILIMCFPIFRTTGGSPGAV